MKPKGIHDIHRSQRICYFTMNYWPKRDKYNFNLVTHEIWCIKIQIEVSHWMAGFLLLLVYFKLFLKESWMRDSIHESFECRIPFFWRAFPVPLPQLFPQAWAAEEVLGQLIVSLLTYCLSLGVARKLRIGAVCFIKIQIYIHDTTKM